MASLPYPRSLLVVFLLLDSGYIAWVWQGCHTLLPFHAAFLLHCYCLIVGRLRGYGRDAIPSYRPPPDRIPSATRSDSVRRPIRFRPPPNQIPSATRSDSVRRRSEIVIRKQTLHPLKTYELIHIVGQKLINLSLKVGLYYNID